MSPRKKMDFTTGLLQPTVRKSWPQGRQMSGFAFFFTQFTTLITGMLGAALY